MARSKRCLGVDIGSTHIRIADVETKANGINIKNLISVPLPEFTDGEFIDEKSRHDAYSQLFKKLNKENKLGGPAVFSVAGNNFLLRKLALPLASEERLEKIIHFESRQQIPLPPDKTIRQYQIFPKPEEKEVEVVLAVAKKENMRSFMKVIDWSGFKARSLSVGSLALFNFFSYIEGEEAEEPKKGKGKGKKGKKGKKGLQLPFMSKKKKRQSVEDDDEDEAFNPAIGADTEVEDHDPFSIDAGMDDEYEEVQAFLSLNSRTLDICIARISPKAKELGFFRSVSLSGPNKEIFKAMQKRLNLDSEFAAQDLLHSNNIAALSFDFDPESNPNLNTEASEVVSDVLDAVVGEVRHSLDFYISQPDGMAVDSVVLCGPLASIPNIGPFFEEKLGLPSTVMSTDDAKRSVTGSNDESIAPFAIPIGLAIEGLNLGIIDKVNFLPEDIKIILEFKSKYVMLGTVAVFLAGTIFLGASLGEKTIQVYTQATRDLERQIQIIEPMWNKMEAAKEKATKISDNYETIYKALPDDRDLPLKLMALIQQQKPPNVFIRKFSIDPYGNMSIVGATDSSDSAVQFVDNIKLNMTKYYNEDAPEEAPRLAGISPPMRIPEFNRVGVQFEIKMQAIGIYSVVQTPTPTPAPVTRGRGMIPGEGRGVLGF